MSNNALSLYRYDHYYKMLQDVQRMEAFKKAIFKQVKKDDIVMDLGAGTGILGILALQAGARKVYFVEQSDAINLARSIVTQNGYRERSIFIQKNSMDTIIPEQLDVIISETLGSFGIDENTLEFTLDARKRFLKPEGILIPEKIEVQYAPVACEKLHQKLSFWDDVYGVDFSPARELFSKKAMIEEIKKQQVKALPEIFAEFNLYTFESSSYQAAHQFQFNEPCTIFGMAGWFEASLAPGVPLSTSPLEPLTHWKQVFFPFKEGIKVIDGDLLETSFEVTPESKNSENTQIRYDYRCTQLADHDRKSNLNKSSGNRDTTQKPEQNPTNSQM